MDDVKGSELKPGEHRWAVKVVYKIPGAYTEKGYTVHAKDAYDAAMIARDIVFPYSGEVVSITRKEV